MIDQIQRLVKQSTFYALCTLLVVAPWLFGGWEMWWFWPLVGLLSLAVLLWGVNVLLDQLGQGSRQESTRSPRSEPRFLLLLWLPFLSYAFLRFLQADVHMEAERSFLLFVTGTIVAAMVVFALNAHQRRWLWRVVFFNLVLLGLYGLINHLVGRSSHVLWAPGYPQYVSESRATGTYFCPDHFAGVMELLLCMSLGVLSARDMRTWQRQMAYAASGIALVGIILSKSRGGGITVVAILGAAMVLAFSQWPKTVRWYARGAMASACLALLALAIIFGAGYTERFASYFTRGQSSRMTLTERKDVLVTSLRHTWRGRMFAAAWDAWKQKPWIGIGPGAHQHWWPHIAASDDGDRETNRWPSLLNNNMHSYEVHNDWLQLLEEYGLVGLGLFLVPAVALATRFIKWIRREEQSCRDTHWVYPSGRRHEQLLAGCFAFVAMSAHSLGDFNLQMPATTWMFAAIIGAAVTAGVQDTPEKHQAGMDEPEEPPQ